MKRMERIGYEKIQRFIMQSIGVDGKTELKIMDLGVDSLSYVQLIVLLENEYNIEFELEDLAINNTVTINDLVEKVLNIINK
ncbi:MULTISPECIES: acyl carrier protein [Blautia]|uniref:acyl carrier protein n=1 Tax=Blautia TaxID=572511 RepID=UPI000BA364B6|nr:MULTISPECIES: acyl carrier protein [Blautia]